MGRANGDSVESTRGSEAAEAMDALVAVQEERINSSLPGYNHLSREGKAIIQGIRKKRKTFAGSKIEKDKVQTMLVADSLRNHIEAFAEDRDISLVEAYATFKADPTTLPVEIKDEEREYVFKAACLMSRVNRSEVETFGEADSEANEQNEAASELDIEPEAEDHVSKLSEMVNSIPGPEREVKTEAETRAARRLKRNAEIPTSLNQNTSLDAEDAEMTSDMYGSAAFDEDDILAEHNL